MSNLAYPVDPPAIPCKEEPHIPQGSEQHGAVRLSLHQRKRFRRPSRQGLRPHLRRSGGSVLPRRPQGRHEPLGHPRRLRNPGDHQPRHHRGRDPRPQIGRPEKIEARSRARRSRTSATSRKAFTGRRPRSKCCCTPSRRTSPRASTPRGNKDEGAGDQGIMFGYACRETPALMPAPLYLQPQDPASCWPMRANAGKEPKLGPDAKSQVTLRYENGKPVEATQIVLSTQHLRRGPDLARHPRDRRALYPPGAARRTGSTTRRSGTSIRPAPS